MAVKPMTKGDVVTTLLNRLASHIRKRPASWSEAALALQACASEILRHAEQEQEDAAQGSLELLSTLLLDAALLIERSERRWSRLAFDLHDSVLQEVAALRMIVRAYEPKLSSGESAATPEQLVAEVLDEIDERLQSLDRSLRELIESFESPALADQPFEESAQSFVREFASSSGVSVTTDLRGDFAILSRSQRIALFRVLVEALTNVRQHSGATCAWVSAELLEGKARLRIRDNGKGLDPQRTPKLAAKKGRLGLVGMEGRVRLLGGKFRISSHPGGPTTITVTIPAGYVDEVSPALRTRVKPAGRP
jgi:signal transduction histidine kinase